MISYKDALFAFRYGSGRAVKGNYYWRVWQSNTYQRMFTP